MSVNKTVFQYCVMTNDILNGYLERTPTCRPISDLLVNPFPQWGHLKPRWVFWCSLSTCTCRDDAQWNVLEQSRHSWNSRLSSIWWISDVEVAAKLSSRNAPSSPNCWATQEALPKEPRVATLTDSSAWLLCWRLLMDLPEFFNVAACNLLFMNWQVLIRDITSRNELADTKENPS